MVKVTDIKLDSANKEAQVTLFADAKADVSSSMAIKGLPEGYSLAQGSSVLTAAGELAFLKSDGTWNWV